MKEPETQGYGEKFARIYNLRWIGFASTIAPVIHAYYERLPIAQSNRSLLDVACGTGQLLAWFLERGYTGTGLDASEHMLAIARKNAGTFAAQGRADFVHADASRFSLARGYGLVVSTFDALNHLPDGESLSTCFSCVHRALAAGGCFIFDLNTRKGLRMWNAVSVEDAEELFIVNRGIFIEESGRAYSKITGFAKVERDRFERFEQTAYNTVFGMRDVEENLLRAGFRDVKLCGSKDFSASVADPEELTRVFFVCGT